VKKLNESINSLSIYRLEIRTGCDETKINSSRFWDIVIGQCYQFYVTQVLPRACGPTGKEHRSYFTNIFIYRNDISTPIL